MCATSSAFGPFLLDREQQKLTRNGVPIALGHRGYVLLESLLEAAGQPVSKHDLMERAWPGTIREEGNLSVQISALRRQLGDGSDALIVTVPRVGYRLVVPGARLDRSFPPLLAVLPFVNHGDVAQDRYFVDGVVDDIRMALSRFRSFGVVSRGSSFMLGDNGSEATAPASELGIRYTLEGSIRRMGDTLRVTTQLIECPGGNHLWGERYEGTLADVFSFQDRITGSVAGVIEPTIRRSEIERAQRKPPSDLDAYDLFLRALPLIGAPRPDGYPEAGALLSKALDRDPGFAIAAAHAAWLSEKRISLRLPSAGAEDHNSESPLPDARSQPAATIPWYAPYRGGYSFG